MKSLNTIFVAAFFLSLGANISLAQDTTSSGKSKEQARAITGCLSAGSSSNSYVLKANDGSSWDLKSDLVSLADHVGHTVTAKGTVSNVTMHNLQEDAAASAGMKKSNNEHGDLDVTSIKMVNKSCK